MSVEAVQGLRRAIQASAGGKYILGAEDLIDYLLIAWLARGHVLIEGRRNRQDALCESALAAARALFQADPVHERHASFGNHRFPYLSARHSVV